MDFPCFSFHTSILDGADNSEIPAGGNADPVARGFRMEWAPDLREGGREGFPGRGIRIASESKQVPTYCRRPKE